MTLDDCDALFAKVRLATSAADLCGLFQQLIETDYTVIRFGIGRGSIFWRARPCAREGYAMFETLLIRRHS